MSQLMSDTLDKATYKHLKNMIKTLCNHSSIVEPQLSYTHQMIDWLRTNTSAQMINWADQQVKEFHRAQGLTYRAIEGRGRPVGSRNKNKAGVRSDYFTRLMAPAEPLTGDYSTGTDPIDDTYLPPIEEQKLVVVPTDESKPGLELAEIKYKIDCVRFDLDNFVNDQKRTNSLTVDNVRELRGIINDQASIIGHLVNRVDNIVESRPNIIELKRPNDLPNIEAGVQHRNFKKLIMACNALKPNGHHHNIWLFGPAGTGKTTAAEKIAEVLELEYRYNGALATKFELVGYPDANGNYVTTAFRETWEHGGVYMFDEIDGSMPDALLSMNGALANSIASFPDKMVPRHKDCIIIAGANTTGLGGGVEYVGAMKQNAAFLNRFEFVPWPHDNALEDALCPNKDWLARVRFVRERVAQKQIKSHLVTMRASISGASLLNAGLDWADVEEMTLKCGMTDAQWGMVS